MVVIHCLCVGSLEKDHVISTPSNIGFTQDVVFTRKPKSVQGYVRVRTTNVRKRHKPEIKRFVASE